MSETRRLVGYVDVVGPDGGSHCFGPGDELPEWAYEKITNPSVWATEPEPAPEADAQDEESSEVPEPPAPPDEPPMTGDAWNPISETDEAPAAEPVVARESIIVEAEEPPRTGKGSGTEEWRAYAEALGIDVPEDASRDQIIELVDSHQS